MAVYDYKAKKSTGATVNGAVVAPSENVAYNIIRDRNLYVIFLRERKKSALVEASLGFFNRVKEKETVIFSRQLSVMISAGVPLVKALKTVVRQTKNVNLKIIISDIADEVDGGAKLSSAMSRYPKVFSNFFVQMIRSAETTGKLDDILLYLADQAEKDYDLKGKVKGALIYPVFILSALVLVGFLMMIFVVPQLLDVLTTGGAELPFSTKALVFVSGFLQSYWWTFIIGGILLYVGGRALSRTQAGRLFIDRSKIRLPIFGKVFNGTYVVRFSRSLATLLTSGVPLAQGLEIVADVVGNVVYHDLTKQTIEEVQGGNSITTVFAKSKEVPLMLSQMMSIGEQSGRLDQILTKISDFYSRELENSMRNLVTMIEPVIMVIIGIGVGLLISAILLPIYNLSSAI